MGRRRRLLFPISVTGSMDPDALNYIAAVEAADGQTLEERVKNEINKLVIGMKADPSPNAGVSNWAATKSIILLSAARTLAGALIPLKGVAPINNNFVANDYNRRLGLKGDGTTKYLNMNRKANDDPQNNCSYGTWVSEATDQSVTAAYMGCNTGGSGSVNLGINNALFLFFRMKCVNATTYPGTSKTTGLIATSRKVSSQYSIWYGNTEVLANDTSDANTNDTVYVFGRSGSTVYSSGRQAVSYIGEATDNAAMNARISAYMSAINSAI